MAGFSTFLISLIVGCVAVQGLRIDPPNLLTKGKFFSPSLRLTRDDPRCTENGIFANLDDCTAYYVCKDGISQNRHCPEGFKFDSIKHCTLDDADCGKSTPPKSPSSSDIMCPADFGYFPYPGDCQKYITCTDGKPKVEICPDQQYYLNYVGCIDWKQCPQDSATVCQTPDGNFPIPGECQKFMRCVNGVPEVKECPRGLGFDHLGRSCVRVQRARCKSNEIHEILN